MNVNKSFYILSFIFIICTSSTCKKDKENCHSEISILNKGIYGAAVQMSFTYSDTTVSKRSVFLGFDSSSVKIHPGDNSFQSWGQGSCFEALFSGGGAHNLLPADTLSIFIFSYDTLRKYDWETIRKEYKILKRYDLSLPDLRNLNWKVVYPPTREMENIKQFPPY